jgi:hypothetical protein
VKALNPEFQAKDPHCPHHLVDLEWTPDAEAAVGGTPVVAIVLAKIGTRDAMKGILVAHHNAIPIYCDLHQRKHISGGNWPGDTKEDKPKFLSGVYNQSQLALGTKLATAVPWDACKDIGGVDIIFDCGRSVVGTEGETDILLQGGFQNGGSVITFHAYPVAQAGSQANTYKSAKAKNRFFKIDLDA